MSQHILEKCNATLAKVANIEATVKAAVKEAFEENELSDNGHRPLSAELMQGILKHFLENFESEMKKTLQQGMQEIKKSMQQEMQAVREEIQTMRSMMAPPTKLNNHELNHASETIILDEEGESFAAFKYEDGNRLQHWHVPKDFEFSDQVNMTTGWGFWLSGIPSKRIRPFRLFKNSHLPRHLQMQFKLHWKPIFTMMELAPNMDHEAIIASHNPPTATEIRDSLEIGRSYLRTDRLSYVFDAKKKKPDKWTIATWSKHCQRSSVIKYGSEKDKSFFPIETSTAVNKPRKMGLKRKRRNDKIQPKNTKIAKAEANATKPAAHVGTTATSAAAADGPVPRPGSSIGYD